MTENPTHLEVVQGKPNLEEANRLVANLTRALIKNEGVGKTLVKTGFNSKALVANLNNFLYDSALTGTGQQDLDAQIRMIKMFRNLLGPFLPEEQNAEDYGVTRAKPKSGKDRRGRRSTGGAGFDPFD